MDVAQVLIAQGGVLPRKQLLRLVGRRRLDRAAAAGVVKPLGRYLALPQIDEHVAVALRINGVTSHLSAALAWGLAVKTVPARAWVTVPRTRHGRSPGVNVVFADLDSSEIVGHTTSALRTVIDCAKRLPFDEALSVADSALRRGLVHESELARAASALSGRGRLQALAVVAAADGRAENPFETCLRAIALEVPGLVVEPQGEIDLGDFTVSPDLVDRDLRLAIEADSHEFHTKKAAHDRDCERFTLLGVRGWLVLRFSWEQVMLRPDFVRQMLEAAVALRTSGHA